MFADKTIVKWQLAHRIRPRLHSFDKAGAHAGENTKWGIEIMGKISMLFAGTRRAMLLATTILACAQTAWAQDAAEGEPVDEIVVTATRQSQSISKVPLSVSAYSQETMDAKGLRSIADVTRITPGLIFETTRNSTNIAIRGISSNAGAATTGIYIDDTPIQIRSLGYGGGTAFPAIFDLERVEVLRGPQGTLFGAGSQGGTVRFITPRPDLDGLSVYARSELAFTDGGDPNFEAGVAVGAPLVTDKVGVRASAWYRRNGGYIDHIPFATNNVDKNANWSDSYVGRLAVTLKPTEDLSITPSIYYQKIKSNAQDNFWSNISDPDRGVLINANPGPETSNDRFVLPSLNIEYSAPGFDVIALGSYFDRKQVADVDYTTFAQSIFTGITFPTLPGQRGTSRFVNSQKNYTAELRFQSNDPSSSLRWVAGVFWSHADQVAIQQNDDLFFPTYIQNFFGVPATVIFGQPLVDGRFIYDQISNSSDKQIAGFGQVDYKVTDQLTLTAGLRYAKTIFEIDADAQGPVVGPRTIDAGRQEEKPFTPKFGVNFQIDEENLLYATVSKGFRPGGYNPAVGLPCGGQLASLGLTDRPELYSADTVWSYEIGTKNRLLNNKLSVEASAYQIDWSNIQQSVQLSSCGFRFVTNLGSVRSRGFDLQVRANPVEGLTLTAAVGYTNAVFQQTVFAGPAAARAIVSEGDHVAGTPWTVSLAAAYDFPINDTADGYMRVDYDHRSQQSAITPTLNPRNGTIDLTIPNPPETNFVGLRAGVRFSDIDISVFALNLFNENNWIARQRDNTRATLYRDTIMRPRTVGVTATLRY